MLATVRVQVERLGLQHLPTAEREQLARERRRARRRLADLEDVVAPSRRSASVASSSSSTLQLIAVSRLLKSCAMPPASCPTASIFCAWRSWAASSARSETSLTVPTQRTGLPDLVADHPAALEHRRVAAIAAPEAVLHLPLRTEPVAGSHESTVPRTRSRSSGWMRSAHHVLGELVLLPAEHPLDRVVPIGRARDEVVVEDDAAHALGHEPEPLVGEPTLGLSVHGGVGGRGALDGLAHRDMLFVGACMFKTAAASLVRHRLEV